MCVCVCDVCVCVHTCVHEHELKYCELYTTIYIMPTIVSCSFSCTVYDSDGLVCVWQVHTLLVFLIQTLHAGYTHAVTIQ